MIKSSNKRTIITGVLIAVLVVIIAGSIVNIVNMDGEAMGTHEDVLAAGAAIPLIDASAPANTETATFALG